MTATVESDRIDRIEAKLDRLSDQLEAFTRTSAALDELIGHVDTGRELVSDIMPLTSGTMLNATERLAEMEQRGYFTFAREGLGVIDRVVTSYDEDDLQALADNVVLILDTIKEMTQPEVLGMMSRTVHAMDETDAEVPSLFRLAGQMRDPDVKKGLSRLMSMLRSMGQTVQEKKEEK